MSLSNPRASVSPVERFFELRLSTGHVGFYDRDAKKDVQVTQPLPGWEEEKKYAANPPFVFVVLDVLSVIGGYSDSKKSGIWSNEIRSTRDEKFVVRTRDGVMAEGLYENIKGDISDKGARFGNSVYIAFEESGEWKLGNLKLIGAGVSTFFDFQKGKRLDREPGVMINGWIGKKKGRNEYYIPNFAQWEVSPAELSVAESLDRLLQQYLGERGGAEPQQEAKSEDPWANASQPSLSSSFDAAPPF